MPLLRGLRTLQEQQESREMRRLIEEISVSIESGSSLAEALAMHPKVFNRLYINMVKAGELAGALEITLHRLAGFMEKGQRIKGKVKSALFYPCAVLLVASAILILMMLFIVPRFKQVFDGLMNGAKLPTFTLYVLKVSETVKQHALWVTIGVAGICFLLWLVLQTKWGRWSFDRMKLVMPLFGPLLRKVAISRFARTLGTLVSSGVPILQALNIVKETAGNVVICNFVSSIHENVKQGEPIAPTMKTLRVFPAMVAGMVDVGEQTGALPEMLMKVADTCDDEVDDAVNAMTSLLEPIMIVLLAVIVGSIVIAMFLPLVKIMTDGFSEPGSERPSGTE